NTFTVTTTGSPTPSILRSGQLPSGLTFVDNGNGTGTLAGVTPITSRGTYNLVFTAMNAAGMDAQNFTLLVVCGGVTVGPPGPNLPAGPVRSPYSQSFPAAVIAGPYTFSVGAGMLPPGLTLNAATGLLSGTPTLDGAFDFTITASDPARCEGARDYRIVICPII